MVKVGISASLTIANRWVRCVIVFLPAAAVYWIASTFAWWPAVDRTLYDLGQLLRPVPQGEASVVVIAVDQATTATFPAPSFPISRHLDGHARVVSRLDSAGATAIVLDILFDSLPHPDAPEVQDLADALHRSGRSVLAAVIERENIMGTATSSQAATVSRLSLPAPLLLNAASTYGLVNVPVDADGVVRRIPCGILFGVLWHPSIVMSAARVHEPELNGRFQPSDTLLIDFAWEASIPHVSYAGVLNDFGWEETVRGRVAVIGVSRHGRIDTHRTPLSIGAEEGRARMAGADIQALAIQSALANGGIVQSDGDTSTVFGLIFLLGLIVLIALLRPLAGMLITILFILSALAGGVIAVALSGIAIPVGPVLPPLVAGAFLGLSLNGLAERSSRLQQQVVLADVRSDLASAHEIQANLQPVRFPRTDRYETCGLQIPCKEVGGDYFDILELPGDRLGLIVADVAGKGVSGSLIMSNLQGRLRHTAREIVSPAEILTDLSELVHAAASPRHQFVTAFYGVYHASSRVLEYGSAGHCYPLLVSANGSVKTLTDGGPLLGPFLGLLWQDYRVVLDEGDTLCIFSDGISEAGGIDSNEFFGENRIAECLRLGTRKPIDWTRDSLLNACREYNKGEPFADDWTLLLLRVPLSATS